MAEFGNSGQGNATMSYGSGGGGVYGGLSVTHLGHKNEKKQQRKKEEAREERRIVGEGMKSTGGEIGSRWEPHRHRHHGTYGRRWEPHHHRHHSADRREMSRVLPQRRRTQIREDDGDDSGDDDGQSRRKHVGWKDAALSKLKAGGSSLWKSVKEKAKEYAKERLKMAATVAKDELIRRAKEKYGASISSKYDEYKGKGGEKMKKMFPKLHQYLKRRREREDEKKEEDKEEEGDVEEPETTEVSKPEPESVEEELENEADGLGDDLEDVVEDGF